MNENAQRLVEIQRLDNDIAETRRQLDAYPRRIQSVEDDASHSRRDVESAGQKLKEARAHRKSIESDIADKQAGIKKLLAQQMQVKTNKEYQAMTHQIGTTQQAIGDLETSVIELLDKEERAEEGIKDLKKSLQRAEREEGEEKARLGVLIEEKKARLASLTAERKALLAQLPEEIAETYSRAVLRHPGSAIVESDGRTCGACHMNLLAHTLQKLKESGSLVPCTACGRLLFLQS